MAWVNVSLAYKCWDTEQRYYIPNCSAVSSSSDYSPEDTPTCPFHESSKATTRLHTLQDFNPLEIGCFCGDPVPAPPLAYVPAILFPLALFAPFLHAILFQRHHLKHAPMLRWVSHLQELYTINGPITTFVRFRSCQPPINLLTTLYCTAPLP